MLLVLVTLVFHLNFAENYNINYQCSYLNVSFYFRLITAATWIMFMQIGFAMYETGSIRAKNTSNILLKSCVDIFTGIIAFYLFGFGMMNNLNGGIIGTGPFAG